MLKNYRTSSRILYMTQHRKVQGQHSKSWGYNRNNRVVQKEKDKVLTYICEKLYIAVLFSNLINLLDAKNGMEKDEGKVSSTFGFQSKREHFSTFPWWIECNNIQIIFRIIENLQRLVCLSFILIQSLN